MERLSFPDSLEQPNAEPGAVARTLLATLKALLEWEARMGGFESPVWDRARAAVAEVERRA